MSLALGSPAYLSRYLSNTPSMYPSISYFKQYLLYAPAIDSNEWGPIGSDPFWCDDGRNSGFPFAQLRLSSLPPCPHNWELSECLLSTMSLWYALMGVSVQLVSKRPYAPCSKHMRLALWSAQLCRPQSHRWSRSYRLRFRSSSTGTGCVSGLVWKRQ